MCRKFPTLICALSLVGYNCDLFRYNRPYSISVYRKFPTLFCALSIDGCKFNLFRDHYPIPICALSVGGLDCDLFKPSRSVCKTFPALQHVCVYDITGCQPF